MRQPQSKPFVCVSYFRRRAYLRLNGQEVSGVSETVEALALFREKLFVFLKNSYVTYKYDGSSLTKDTFDVYDTPIVKNAYRWKILHYGIAYGYKGSIGTGIRGENNLLLFKDSETEAYEMIPLGVFVVDKPMYNSRKTISIDAYEKVLGGESFDTIPFGYRRHVRNKAVDEVKRGALSVSAYMQHFGR